jgi:hypothetical protein
MPFCLLSPTNDRITGESSTLEAFENPPTETAPNIKLVERLMVEDVVGNYGADEAFGVWIHRFNGFLQREISKHTAESFEFEDRDTLGIETLNEINPVYLRNLIIVFINEYYKNWKDKEVKIADPGDAEDNAEEVCEGCTQRSSCETHCVDYSDIYEDYMVEHTICDMTALEICWENFKKEHGLTDLPEMKFSKIKLRAE